MSRKPNPTITPTPTSITGLPPRVASPPPTAFARLPAWLALLLLTGGCATTSREPATAPDGTWRPAPVQEVAIALSDRTLAAARITPPPDLTIRTPSTPGEPLPPDQRLHNSIILRMSAQVSPGTLVECDPANGHARATSGTQRLSRELPGPIEDAAIVNRARNQISPLNLPRNTAITSERGRVKIDTRSLTADEAATLLNTVLAISKVREVTLTTNGPIRIE